MKPLLTTAFDVAFAASILPWIGRFGSAVDITARVSLALTVAWFLLLVLTLLKLRRRGLWALLAIYWPCVFSLIVSAFAQNVRNCA
jgi:hypothetical protein